MKTCKECKKTKEVSEFGKSSRHKDGLRSKCLVCRRIAGRKHYKKTLEYQRNRKKSKPVKSPKAIKKEKSDQLAKSGKKECNSCLKVKDFFDYQKDKQKPYGVASDCRDCRNLKLRNKYKRDPNYADTMKTRHSEYYQNNKEKVHKAANIRNKRRQKTDVLYALKKKVKRRIYDIARTKGWKTNDKKDKYLGCSYVELKLHLESLFEEGMSWDNHTTDGWHIDHVIPISVADSYEEARRLNHYTNLAPMWAKSNIKKGDKYEIPNRVKYLSKHELLPNEKEKKEIIDQFNAKKRRIFARKCKIKVINNSIEKEFLNSTHLSGYSPSRIAYGLYYKDVLVMCMSFGVPRFNSAYQWEITRMSTLMGVVVVGGASKLFKHFIKDKDPKSIISYCDLRYSDGDVYSKLGMQRKNDTPSNYWYVKGDIVYPRYQCMKHKLSKKIPIFISKFTEVENMMINGFTKVYDLGNAKFTWEK